MVDGGKGEKGKRKIIQISYLLSHVTRLMSHVSRLISHIFFLHALKKTEGNRSAKKGDPGNVGKNSGK